MSITPNRGGTVRIHDTHFLRSKDVGSSFREDLPDSSADYADYADSSWAPREVNSLLHLSVSGQLSVFICVHPWLIDSGFSWCHWCP